MGQRSADERLVLRRREDEYQGLRRRTPELDYAPQAPSRRGRRPV